MDGAGAQARHRLDDFVALLELGEAIVLSIDVETGDVTLLGPASGQRLGLPIDVAIGSDAFWSFIPMPSRGELLELVDRVGRDGGDGTIEHPAVLAHRGEVWFRTSVKRRPTEGPLLGLMLDVTEARHEAAHAREVESWLVTLGETMPFDFWICDREGRCVLQNPRSAARVGERRGSTSQDWEPSIAAALRGHRSREELQDTGDDGLRRHRIRFVAPVSREDGVRAVLGVEIDITELKRTEEELRRSLVELRDAQQTLVRKEQLAALGEMSATVAHEIRNPLAAMSNAVALLQKRAAPCTDTSALWDIIRDELQRLARLVANLLDTVRPLQPMLVPSSLAGVADAAWARVIKESPGPVRLHRVVAPEMPLVPLDESLLDHALTNVFRNALQAMPEGGDVFMTIALREDETGPRAHVTIRDSGTGLPPDLEDRLFEPFVTTRPTGSGLGLALVKRIVEEHDGTVELSSEPGSGATCVILLPAAAGQVR